MPGCRCVVGTLGICTAVDVRPGSLHAYGRDYDRQAARRTRLGLCYREFVCSHLDVLPGAHPDFYAKLFPCGRVRLWCLLHLFSSEHLLFLLYLASPHGRRG